MMDKEYIKNLARRVELLDAGLSHESGRWGGIGMCSDPKNVGQLVNALIISDAINNLAYAIRTNDDRFISRLKNIPQDIIALDSAVRDMVFAETEETEKQNEH